MEQVIDFIEHQRVVTTYERRDAFVFRKDRKYHWLQKACFWLLGKIGAYDHGETVTYVRHRIEARTFMDRLFKQRAQLLSFFNREPKRLLIGAEDYAEMMQTAPISQQFSFQAEYGRNRQICGLTVEVIPWMRGILVMP